MCSIYILEAAIGAMVLQWILSLEPSLANELLKLARASLANTINKYVYINF